MLKVEEVIKVVRQRISTHQAAEARGEEDKGRQREDRQEQLATSQTLRQVALEQVKAVSSAVKILDRQDRCRDTTPVDLFADVAKEAEEAATCTRVAAAAELEGAEARVAAELKEAEARVAAVAAAQAQEAKALHQAQEAKALHQAHAEAHAQAQVGETAAAEAAQEDEAAKEEAAAAAAREAGAKEKAARKKAAATLTLTLKKAAATATKAKEGGATPTRLHTPTQSSVRATREKHALSSQLPSAMLTKARTSTGEHVRNSTITSKTPSLVEFQRQMEHERLLGLNLNTLNIA